MVVHCSFTLLKAPKYLVALVVARLRRAANSVYTTSHSLSSFQCPKFGPTPSWHQLPRKPKANCRLQSLDLTTWQPITKSDPRLSLEPLHGLVSSHLIAYPRHPKRACDIPPFATQTTTNIRSHRHVGIHQTSLHSDHDARCHVCFFQTTVLTSVPNYRICRTTTPLPMHHVHEHRKT